ncbi:unnamed protein product [Spirodela intermedia]|uniref:Uncharacterized protein n=1 Tax=Spirodela intermedia TaxID=51605 RepID=A0A7I8J7F2_SPIIN|nr:unnamed protein product [Spirodela intermedia]CAA6666166.1 unnamed protein product [Spirodela intermedia]
MPLGFELRAKGCAGAGDIETEREREGAEEGQRRPPVPGGAFVALGVRSASQQGDIDELEAEKESLRRRNKAMQETMWGWRQSLFNLAASDPSSFPVPLSRLRAIYGDEDESDAATSFAPPPSQNLDIPGETGAPTPSPAPRFTV